MRGRARVLASLALAILIAALSAGVAAALPTDPPSGCTTTTTLNDSGNYFEGSDGATDEIFGRGGDDQLLGKGANDCIYGEDGGDNLQGGIGDDYLDGCLLYTSDAADE